MFSIFGCLSIYIFLATEAAKTAAAIQSKRLKGKSYREAADKAEVKTKKPETKTLELAKKKTAPSQTSLSGLIAEVVITVPPGHPSLVNGKADDSPSAAEETMDHSNSDLPRKKKPRAATKRVVIISDDDVSGSDNDKPNRRRSRVSTSKLPKKRGALKDSSASSDYEEESAEDSTSDVEVSAAESDNDEKSDASQLKSKVVKGVKQKTKVQPKPKPSSSSRASSSNEETDGDSMDVDEPPPAAKKKNNKRKATDGDGPPAKKAKRTDTDPWKLEQKSVTKDWTQMHAPPFEMFHFARKVVDEYTYLDGKIHAMVTSLTAGRHWVLSGTPPIHDFAALKTIAAFLSLHLGVDDDGEGQSAEVKKRRREQTGERCVIFFLYFLTSMQLSRDFTLFVKYTVSNGMRIAISLVRPSWISSFVKLVFNICTFSQYFLTSNKRRMWLKSTKSPGRRKSRKSLSQQLSEQSTWNSNITYVLLT